MKKVTVKRIDEKRFNAYVGLSRSPYVKRFAQEIDWFANEDESILGVILFDYSDKDYNSIILGKDEVGKYRAFDLLTSVASFEAALEWLTNTINWNTGLGKKVFPQGNPTKTCNLFNPVVSVENMHPYFMALDRDPLFSPAKELIIQLMPHFVDIDGNFVEQFQTTGFDSRLWELYLFEYFAEEGLTIGRNQRAPDFIISDGNDEAAIEAVTVGRKEKVETYIKFGRRKDKVDVENMNKNEMPLLFGSSLYSKMKKRYWEMANVVGKAFVLAIADFHEDQSMLWSFTALIRYLYGYEHKYHYKNGKLIIEPAKIGFDKNGIKIEAFFDSKDSENVSAVMFSASGTLSKFNRIGKQCGFGRKNLLMIRYGTYHNHDKNASKPLLFRYVVDETCQESWAEGISIYHNPKAKIRLEPGLFPNAAHHFLENGQIRSILPDFYPYGSVTTNIMVKD